MRSRRRASTARAPSGRSRASRPAEARRSATRSSARSGCSASNSPRQGNGDAQGPRRPPALRRLEHGGHGHLDGSGRGQAGGHPRLHDRARHASAACSTCRRSARASERFRFRRIPRRSRRSRTRRVASRSPRSTSPTLKKVYDHIGTRVSSTKEQKELTFVVAGIAAVLLAAAAASSWPAEDHMTFADPYLLIALVAVPLGLIATSCSPAAAAAPREPPRTRPCGPT